MARIALTAATVVALASVALPGCDDDGIFGPQCSATWPCDPGYVCDMVLYYCVPDPDAGTGDADASDAEDVGDGSGGDTSDGDTDAGDTDAGDTTVDDTSPIDTDDASDTTTPDTDDTSTDPGDTDSGGTIEVCDNGDDDDLDGDTDCDDTDCAETTACLVCEVWEIPRGGICVDEFDPDGVDAFTGTLSYLRGFRIPPNGTEAECCFDFDGDGEIDNALALLVGALGATGGEFDFDEMLQSQIESGDSAVVFEWGKGPSGNGFWAYDVTNDLDGNGVPDQSWSTRQAGAGTFRILSRSVDEFGALTQFNTATDTGTRFSAGPSDVYLTLPGMVADEASGLAALFLLPAGVGIDRARLEGVYTTDANGRWSVDEEFVMDGAWSMFGGWKLGGVVAFDEIAESMEAALAECTCAGFDPFEPIIVYGDDGDTYQLACAQTPSTDCTADDGGVCENIGMLCSLLPSLPGLGLVDIDTNGNGVGDAMSVGFRISATGATFADPPVE